MPTATPFKALGRGNGFPFCIQEADVTGYHKYITLSGHTEADGTPTQQSINDSFAKAMQLFWNAEGLSGGASASVTDSDDNVTTTSATNVSFADSETDNVEPVGRVCGPIEDGENENDNSDGFGATVSADVVIKNLRIVRMIDSGSTVGYGVFQNDFEEGFDFDTTGFAFALAAGDAAGPSSDATVYWKSAISTEEKNFLDDPGPSSAFNISTHSVNGIHFLSVAFATTTDDGNPSASKNNASVTKNEDGSVDCSASLTNMSFWSYS